MYAAELALKERIEEALQRLATALQVAAEASHAPPSSSDCAAAATASGSSMTAAAARLAAASSEQLAEQAPTREEMTVWLSAWLLSPMLHTRRLAEIDELVASEIAGADL